MKRLLLLIAALLHLCGTALAKTDDPSEVAAFSAGLLPGWTLLDGCLMDETAMLLVENDQEQIHFAGCVRQKDGWAVTLSAPLPDGANPGLDTFHAGEGSIRVWIDLPPERRAYEDSDSIYAVVELQADGTWRITIVNTGWDVIELRRQSIHDDLGFTFYGDMSLCLDITQTDWAALPASFHQAMALLDTTRWRLIREDGTPLYSAQGILSGYGAAGAAVQLLSVSDGMAEVRFIGREDTVFVAEDSLLPGSEQPARYDVWCGDGFLYGTREIILCADDPAVTWYAAAHEDSTAEGFPVAHVEYVTLLGWCADGCCCLMYSEPLGRAGYMPLPQLPHPVK